MSQTGIIFATLVIGFLVYVTTRGRLPLYVGVIWKKAAASAPNASAIPSNPVKANILPQLPDIGQTQAFPF